MTATVGYGDVSMRLVLYSIDNSHAFLPDIAYLCCYVPRYLM
jgi:hypothetical protein